MKPDLLVKTERGGFSEKFHYGFISLIDEKFNKVAQIGDDCNLPFPFRSSAKPLQASVLLDSGAFDFLGLDRSELAVICSSHTGSVMHTEKVAGILKKIGLNEQNLQCGAHIPLDIDEKNRLIKEDKQPTNLHNNCSGKHAGMLAVCIRNNWDISDYLDVNHPLQVQIKQNIQHLCRLKELPPTAGDGCSAPVHIMPYFNMGVGFLNLFIDDKYMEIKNAMAEHPYLSGGIGRLDSEIINATSGNLIAKVAAEGLCIVANVNEKKVLVVKIADADMKARSIVVIECLLQLGWLSNSVICDSDKLKSLFDKEIKNLKQQTVGEIKTVFQF